MVRWTKTKILLVTLLVLFGLAAIGVVLYLYFQFGRKPDEPDFVLQLTGTPLRIQPNGIFTLNWNVQNANKVTLDQNDLDVTGLTTLSYPVGSTTGSIQFVLSAVKDLPTGQQATVTSSWVGYVDQTSVPLIFFESFYATNNYYKSYADFASQPGSLQLSWVVSTDESIASLVLVRTVEADYSGTPDIPKVLRIPLNVGNNLPTGAYTVTLDTIPDIKTGIFSVLYRLEVTNTDKQTVESNQVIVQFGGSSQPPNVNMRTDPVSGSINAGEDVKVIWYISNVGDNETISIATVLLGQEGETVVWTAYTASGQLTIPAIEGTTRVIFRIQSIDTNGKLSDTGLEYFNFIVQVNSLGINNVSLYQTTSAGYFPNPQTNYPGWCQQAPYYSLPFNVTPTGVAKMQNLDIENNPADGDMMANFYTYKSIYMYPCLNYSNGIDVGVTNIGISGGPLPETTVFPSWPTCVSGNSNPLCAFKPLHHNVNPKGPFLCSPYISGGDVGCPTLLDSVTQTNVWSPSPLTYTDALSGLQEQNIMRYTLLADDQLFNGFGTAGDKYTFTDWYSGAVSVPYNSWGFGGKFSPGPTLDNEYQSFLGPSDAEANNPPYINKGLCLQSDPASSNGKLSWAMLGALYSQYVSGSQQPIGSNGLPITGWKTSGIPMPFYNFSQPAVQATSEYPLPWEVNECIYNNCNNAIKSSSIQAPTLTGALSFTSKDFLGTYIFTSNSQTPPNIKN